MDELNRDKLNIELQYRLLTLKKEPNKAGRYEMTIGSLLENKNTEQILLYRENIKELRDNLNEILSE